MNNLGPTAVIFDLDGTLVDSEPNYFEAGRQVLAEHGVPDFTWADHERYVGISTQETVALWRERYGLRASVAELLAAKNRAYLGLARTATRVYPEMRTFVELLAGESVPMAVASGSSPEAIKAILTGTGLDAHLRTVVSADEVERGKPAPDVFLEAAQPARRGPGRLRGPGGRGARCRRRARGRDALHRHPLCRRAGRRAGVRDGWAAPARRSDGVHGTGRVRVARTLSAPLEVRCGSAP